VRRDATLSQRKSTFPRFALLALHAPHGRRTSAPPMYSVPRSPAAAAAARKEGRAARPRGRKAAGRPVVRRSSATLCRVRATPTARCSERVHARLCARSGSAIVNSGLRSLAKGSSVGTAHARAQSRGPTCRSICRALATPTAAANRQRGVHFSVRPRYVNPGGEPNIAIAQPCVFGLPPLEVL
jgi:hypothetical protein